MEEQATVIDDQIHFIEILNQDLKKNTSKFLSKNPEISFFKLTQRLDSFLEKRDGDISNLTKLVSDFREYFDYVFLNVKITEYEKEVLSDFIDEMIYELK